MLSCFSHVRLFATLWTVAHKAPLCMGFSRQEYWSGLPFPSPEDLPDPGIEPRSPTLQADALPSEPPGKLKNTGVGCHSLLQGIFLTQGLNPGLPHCRQTLYCLSHQGSSVQFSCSVVSDSLRPHESQHTRPPCPSPTPGVHSDSRPSSQ